MRFTIFAGGIFSALLVVWFAYLGMKVFGTYGYNDFIRDRMCPKIESKNVSLHHAVIEVRKGKCWDHSWLSAKKGISGLICDFKKPISINVPGLTHLHSYYFDPGRYLIKMTNDATEHCNYALTFGEFDKRGYIEPKRYCYSRVSNRRKGTHYLIQKNYVRTTSLGVAHIYVRALHDVSGAYVTGISVGFVRKSGPPFKTIRRLFADETFGTVSCEAEPRAMYDLLLPN